MFNKILVVLFSFLVVLGLAQPVKAAAQTNCFDYTYSPRYTAEWGLPIGGADIGDSGVALNHSEYLSLYVQEGCTVTTLLEAEIYYVSKGSKGLEIIGARGYSPKVVAQAIAQHAHESAVQRMADKANAKRSDGIGMFISVILTALLSSIRGHKDENESFFDNERAVVSITVAICVIMAVVAIIAGASIVPTKGECWPVCQSNSALGTVISLVFIAIWDFVCKHGKITHEDKNGCCYEYNAQAMMVALPDVNSAVDADNCAAYKIGALALSTDPAVEQAVMQWHMRLHAMYDTTTRELPAISQTAEEEDWRYACIFEAQGEVWQSKRGL